MNIQNTFVRRAVLVLAIIIISALPAASHATVGGSTYIYSFKYNPTNESIYFVQQNEGGRGCPPELLKMSLATGKTDVVFSCSQGESLMTADGTTNTASVNSAINTIVKDFKDLTPIHLSKNSVAVDVNFVSSEKLSPEDDWTVRSHFIAKVFQDTIKVAEIPIVGCAVDQPFVFAGYAIPGLEKKILLLLSTKGDCFEGGYINETLYPVGNITYLDKTQATDSWKTASPLMPSAATLVVFEKDSAGASVTPTDGIKPIDSAPTSATEPAGPQDNSYTLVPLAGATVVGTLIGFVLGALIFRNRRNNNSPTI